MQKDLALREDYHVLQDIHTPVFLQVSIFPLDLFQVKSIYVQ